MHIIGQETIFLLNKSEITQVKTSVGTFVNRRNWVLHHLNPLSLDSKLTRKGKLGKNTKWSKGQRDADSSTRKLRQQWPIVFLLFNSPLFNVSKGFLIWYSKGVMEGQIRDISRHVEGQDTRDLDPHQGKLQKYLDLCTHPDVRGFEVNIRVYTWVWD